jgi:hypothetical protein
MRKYLMVFIAVMLASAAASAQTQGYIGLFADVDHSSWCTSAASVPGNFNMWIFVLAKEGGTFGAEFKLQMPDDPSLIAGTKTPHPDASGAILGDPLTGVSFTWLSCQEGWTWVYQYLMIDTSGNQNIVEIVPHPTAGGPNMVECSGTRPIYPAVIFNKLYVNYTDGVDPECSETGTSSKSWGAIKSIYAE